MILRIARALSRSRAGSASEFALTLPVWLITILAVVNIGRFFVARAGIQNGMGEAARIATLWPRKSDAEIRAAFTNGTFGLTSSEAPELDLATGTANGQAYVDLDVEYEPQFYLMFVEISPVTLNYSRRAFRPT
jgi:Flp pilus assembly protein TadG